MTCPKCKNENPDGAAYCEVCYEVLIKKKPAPAAEAPPVPAPSPRTPDILAAAPFAVAFAVALGYARHFRDYLPITEGWGHFENWLFPLSLSDVVFHEAGHPIFGLLGLGNRFIMVAGGTLMQLLVPTVCGVQFLRQRSKAGVAFVGFWIGLNLAEISLYAADAKAQVLILITGMDGREGGMHDWHYLFGRLGVTDHCVGIAQGIFFCGCFLMAFSPAWGLAALARRWTTARA